MGASALLVDSYHPQLRGGTGKTGDWNMAARLLNSFPFYYWRFETEMLQRQFKQPIRVGADVSSGIEFKPGKKTMQLY